MPCQDKHRPGRPRGSGARRWQMAERAAQLKRRGRRGRRRGGHPCRPRAKRPAGVIAGRDDFPSRGQRRPYWWPAWSSREAPDSADRKVTFTAAAALKGTPSLTERGRGAGGGTCAAPSVTSAGPLSSGPGSPYVLMAVRHDRTGKGDPGSWAWACAPLYAVGNACPSPDRPEYLAVH